MPQLQYLGDIEKETAGGYLAKVLGGGVSTGLQTYVGMKEKGRERAMKEREMTLQESEIDLKKKQLEKDYSKLDYDKRKDAYDSMVKLLPQLPPDKQAELTTSVEWTELEKSLGLPSLSGSTLSPEKPKPSWGQEQEDASIRADILRGKGSTYSLMGEPEPFVMETREDALDYLSKRNRNPANYEAELNQKFGTGTPTIPTPGGRRQKSPYKEYPDAYLDKGVWKVKRGGKVYRIEE